MPIFEYLCVPCNRIYSFLALSASVHRQPVCPRCGSSDLHRVPSSFAVSHPSPKGEGREKAKQEPPGDLPSGLERELESLMGNLDEREMEDPKTMGRLMRRLAEASGEPMPKTLEEMIRRMEAGEDPDKLDEELGPLLEAELGEEEASAAPKAPERDPGLYSL